MTVAFRSIQSGDMAGLHAYIESKLPPKDLEKKQFGEVFTPLPLVNEMLDAVAKYGDKGIWSNPNLKILDPAAGIVTSHWWPMKNSWRAYRGPRVSKRTRNDAVTSSRICFTWWS
jgi:hypothetical protein